MSDIKIGDRVKIVEGFWRGIEGVITGFAEDGRHLVRPELPMHRWKLQKITKESAP